MTIALEPPSPTPGGIDVDHTVAVRAAAGSSRRANRVTVARTSSLSGEMASAGAGRRARARARWLSRVSASTAPP